MVRNQSPINLKVESAAVWVTESSDRADGFSKLVVGEPSKVEVVAKPQTSNQPLSSLTDGKIEAEQYGPIFSNSVGSGIYRMDLGKSQAVHSISTWSTNKGNSRGPQRFTLYGSNSDGNPGWRINNRRKVTPLGTVDTRSLKQGKFTATALQGRDGKSLGTFRWIYWQVAPVTDKGENTALQEFQVK